MALVLHQHLQQSSKGMMARLQKSLHTLQHTATTTILKMTNSKMMMTKTKTTMMTVRTTVRTIARILRMQTAMVGGTGNSRG